MKSIITAGIATIFTVVILMAIPTLSISASHVVATTMASTTIVILLCELMYSARMKSRSMHRRPAKPRTPRGQPNPLSFDERLHQFSNSMGIQQESLSARPRVTRQLWMADTSLERTPPRPASYFRQILQRIRELVARNGR